MPSPIRSLVPRAASALLVFSCATAQVAAAQLHDNGPFVTGPRAGGGSNSMIQASVGLVQEGWNADANLEPPFGPRRIADNFIVPAGQIWNVTSVRVFAIQWGTSTTPVFDFGSLRIWQGPPGVAGASVQFGDETTNRLTATAFTNTWRVSEYFPDLDVFPIMWADLQVPGGLVLGAGDYWVDFNLGAPAASGTWAIVPPVTLPGQSVTAANGAARIRASNTWSEITDNEGLGNPAQDIPFMVFGTVLADDPHVVPEPGTWALLATGLAGLGVVARRRAR